MKRCLSVLLVLSVLLCALPAGADTRYCPYCGTKVDSAYSFCPSCGKSLSGTGSAGSTGTPSSGYGSDRIPGFNLSFNELKEIFTGMYRNPKGTYNRGLSNFPVRVSIDLQSEDGLYRMNFPNMKHEQSGNEVADIWRYDITRGRFLTEDEKFGSSVQIRYYHLSSKGHPGWTNMILINMHDNDEISYFSVTAGTSSVKSKTSRSDDIDYTMYNKTTGKNVTFRIENGKLKYQVAFPGYVQESAW